MSIQDDEKGPNEGLLSDTGEGMNRRKFLKLTGVAAASLAVGGAFAGTLAESALATSAAGPSGRPATPIHPPKQLIDAYSHIMPQPFYDTVLQLAGGVGKTDPSVMAYTIMLNGASTTAKGRLEVMDAEGVSMCILIPSPLEAIYTVWPVPPLALAAAGAWNDILAGWVTAHPDRFKFCALLPTGQPDAMVTELTRAVTEKGAIGGFIACGPAARPLDDFGHYGPLYAKAVELNVPLWMHPVRPPTVADYTYGPPTAPLTSSKYSLGMVIGWPFDTSMAMLRLTFSGVFKNYPGLKIVAHHQGGLIPTWWPRANDMMQYFMKNTLGFQGPAIDKDQWELHIKNFYVDTCSSAVSPDILKLTYDFFGPDHVLFGTDSPVDHVAEPPDMFVPNSLASIQGMHLNEPAQRKIYAENVLSIIPQG